MAPIRILQYGFGDKYYGTEHVILNLYRHLDRSRYQFDFLVDHKYKSVAYEAEVEKLGGHVYREYYRVNEILQPGYISPTEFWRRHPEIQGGIHFNVQTYGTWNIQLIRAAKKRDMPIRIIHMHSAMQGYPVGLRTRLQHMLVRPRAGYYSNKNLACSILAAQWGGFDKNCFESFPNAIEVDKFAYSPTTRDRVRDVNGLTHKLVLGFVGRLCAGKNPDFLLEVLQEVNRRRNDAVLVVVGDGYLRDQLRHKAAAMSLENVRFIGAVNNVHEWMQTFDVLLLPSKFEGLPVVLVEGQASGLMCFASDNVSSEAAVTNRLSYLSTDEPKLWADAILNVDISYDRSCGRNLVATAGYDIGESVKRLEAIYDGLLDRK